jgi:hypothetical protein
MATNEVGPTMYGIRGHRPMTAAEDAAARRLAERTLADTDHWRRVAAELGAPTVPDAVPDARAVCRCSCHDCCVPLHEACGDCEEDHQAPAPVAAE